MVVPDWNPFTKTKPRHPAPWGNGDEGGAVMTTYNTHYGEKLPQPKRDKIPPRIEYPWKDYSGAPRMGKSTAGDSFMDPPTGFSQMGSFKPKRNWESVANEAPLTTTHQTGYKDYPGFVKRGAIRPAIREKDFSRFTARATSDGESACKHTSHKRDRCASVWSHVWPPQAFAYPRRTPHTLCARAPSLASSALWTVHANARAA